MYDDVTRCIIMWHYLCHQTSTVTTQVWWWWCLVTLCMMMWRHVWWCYTIYDDVTLFMPSNKYCNDAGVLTHPALNWTQSLNPIMCKCRSISTLTSHEYFRHYANYRHIDVCETPCLICKWSCISTVPPIQTQTHSRAHARARTHTHARAHTHTHTYRRARELTHRSIISHTLTNIHDDENTLTHIHIHVHTQVQIGRKHLSARRQMWQAWNGFPSKKPQSLIPSPGVSVSEKKNIPVTNTKGGNMQFSPSLSPFSPWARCSSLSEPEPKP